jgi:pyroglutamyl-peptidase
VSGFPSLSGRTPNSSLVLGQSMAKGNPDVAFVELPVIWGIPMEVVGNWPRGPRVWLATGEAAHTLRLETLARNRRIAHVDQRGHLPPTLDIIPGGPTLRNPSHAVALSARLTAAGFPTSLSAHAGCYLCEELFYSLLHQRTHAWGHATMVFFLHVPVFGTPLPTPATQSTPARKIDRPYLARLGRTLHSAIHALLASR